MSEQNEEHTNYNESKFTEDISMQQFTDELMRLDEGKRQELLAYIQQLKTR